MTHTIQLDLPDALYNAIQCCAAVQGSDPATVAVSALNQHFQTTNELKTTSGAGSIEELFGAVDLGHPTGLDNETLDADLAKEYARELAN